MIQVEHPIDTLDPVAKPLDVRRRFGMSGALIGFAQFSMVTDIAVLTTVAAVFLGLGARSFSRIQI